MTIGHTPSEYQDFTRHLNDIRGKSAMAQPERAWRDVGEVQKSAQPEVPLELERMGSVTEELGKVVEVLYSRLTPVLMPASPSSPDAVSTGPVSTPVACAIRMHRERVQGQIAMLYELLHRIAL